MKEQLRYIVKHEIGLKFEKYTVKDDLELGIKISSGIMALIFGLTFLEYKFWLTVFLLNVMQIVSLLSASGLVFYYIFLKYTVGFKEKKKGGKKLNSPFKKDDFDKIYDQNRKSFSDANNKRESKNYLRHSENYQPRMRISNNKRRQTTNNVLSFRNGQVTPVNIRKNSYLSPNQNRSNQGGIDRTNQQHVNYIDTSKGNQFNNNYRPSQPYVSHQNSDDDNDHFQGQMNHQNQQFHQHKQRQTIDLMSFVPKEIQEQQTSNNNGFLSFRNTITPQQNSMRFNQSRSNFNSNHQSRGFFNINRQNSVTSVRGTPSKPKKFISTSPNGNLLNRLQDRQFQDRNTMFTQLQKQKSQRYIINNLEMSFEYLDECIIKMQIWFQNFILPKIIHENSQNFSILNRLLEDYYGKQLMEWNDFKILLQEDQSYQYQQQEYQFSDKQLYGQKYDVITMEQLFQYERTLNQIGNMWDIKESSKLKEKEVTKSILHHLQHRKKLNQYFYINQKLQVTSKVFERIFRLNEDIVNNRQYEQGEIKSHQQPTDTQILSSIFFNFINDVTIPENENKDGSKSRHIVTDIDQFFIRSAKEGDLKFVNMLDKFKEPHFDVFAGKQQMPCYNGPNNIYQACVFFLYQIKLPPKKGEFYHDNKGLFKKLMDHLFVNFNNHNDMSFSFNR